MLSSRPQHVLYTDKENAVSAAPSRKGAGLSVHGQANMLKTPGAKQQQQQQSHMRGAAKTVKATSSKQSLESTQLKDRKLGGPATIALEPGARVLGAKDGNNRALHGGRAGSDNGKGKGRAMDAVYDDCSLMREFFRCSTMMPLPLSISRADKQGHYSPQECCNCQEKCTRGAQIFKEGCCQFCDSAGSSSSNYCQNTRTANC